MENTNASKTPYNALTGKPYQGSNIETLFDAMDEGGYDDLRFLTFKQALELGRVVRKGEKAAARVVRWFKVVDGKRVEADEDTEETKPKGKKRMGKKTFVVFNYEQTDALPEEVAA